MNRIIQNDDAALRVSLFGTTVNCLAVGSYVDCGIRDSETNVASAAYHAVRWYSQHGVFPSDSTGPTTEDPGTSNQVLLHDCADCCDIRLFDNLWKLTPSAATLGDGGQELPQVFVDAAWAVVCWYSGRDIHPELT